MKKLFLAVIVLFVTKIYASGNSGGMDGGGGGTLPTHPAPVHLIREIVSESKAKLLHLLNKYETRTEYDDSNTLLKKLYGGPRKAQDVLNDLRVEIREEKPCLTSHGTEVDASIHAVKPNTICISAFRISKKIDQAIVEREILALLAHEVSHFMGADETEAEKIQKDVAWSILNGTYGPAYDPKKSRDEISSAADFIRKTAEEIQKGELNSAADWLSRALAALTHAQGSSADSIFKIFSPREMDYQDVLRLRLFWAHRYLETLIPGQNQSSKQKEYENRFGDKDFVELKEEFFSDTHSYVNERIDKIKSSNDLVKLLKVLHREYEVRAAYSWQSIYGNNWLSLEGHLTKTFSNPWVNFTGVYSVKNAECTAKSSFTSELTELKVYWSGENLYLGKVYPNMFSNDRIVLGAYNVNTYLNDYGLISEGKVYMTHQMGGTWSDRMYLHRTTSKLTLETLPNQTFKITIENTFEDRDVTKPDMNNSCVLTGIHQK